MLKVSKTPALPRLTGPGVSVLVRELYRSLSEHAYRLNLVLPMDGSELMTGPLPMATYAVSGLPSASTYVGRWIFISDETGGPVPAYSDGTNWRRASDGDIAS